MRQAMATLLAILGLAPAVAEQRGGPGDVAELLARVGARVEEYFGHAQSIMYEETIVLQPLGPDLSWNGSHARKLVYELRVVREPTVDGKPPEANEIRRLLSVDGRPPRPADESACDVKSVTPEPLAMLLPGQQSDYTFTPAGSRHRRDAATAMLDFKSVSSPPVKVTWKTEECAELDVPGRSRGRVWIDAATGNVLRLDQHLLSSFEIPLPRARARGGPLSMVFERADSSVHYRAVEFHDPDETVLLPESIVSLEIVRVSGRPRLRIFQTFSNYRRFITDGRIVTEPAR